MQNVKKEKVNSINDILEEIVRCVTAPSFCVMPWKCVTMAVGDRTDPLVKKSVVHIYRKCVAGQNIFQIKVHNCKKEVCDHPICTKDCEESHSGKETVQNDLNKRKRKKRNKYPDLNKETTLGCCLMNKIAGDEYEKDPCLKEHKDNKHRNTSAQKNKRISRKSENKEKPSCTLQIFADGKSRKLNFQLHPAMKVFLGKALDRLEGSDAKGPRPSSPSYAMPDYCQELLGKANDSCKSKFAKTVKKLSTNSQCCNKNKRTESVEEFEINLPDNTSHTKNRLVDLRKRCSFSQISKRSCHCDVDQISEDLENNGSYSEMKIKKGYLMDNNPVQQSHCGKGKSDKETLTVRTELHLGQSPDRCHNEHLTTDNTHQKMVNEPVSEHQHNNHNDGKPTGDEQRFHPSDRNPLTFQNQQADICTPKYDNIGVNTEVKQSPTETFWNISCGNENNPPYINSSRCFPNRTGDNIIRTPYIVDYHCDNNGVLVNDIRNINNQNYSISDHKAPMHSTDYINTPTIYRSNIRYSPPIVHDSFSMSPEQGTFLTSDGVYNNRFYGPQQYHNFTNHGKDFMNMRVAPTHLYKLPANQHRMVFSKERINRETQISHEEPENLTEYRRFNRYRLSNARDIDAYPESENKMFFREPNKIEPRQYKGDAPANNRSRNNIKDQRRNKNDYEESTDNDLEDKLQYDCQRYLRSGDVGEGSEIRTDHPPNKPIKRANKSEKSNSNGGNKKTEHSTAEHYYHLQSTSSIIESKTSSNKQYPSDKMRRKENKRFTRRAKKNRKENITNEPGLLQNTNKMEQNGNSKTHSDYKLINKPRIQYRNEEENFFERQENFGNFKHIRPSKITSAEKVKNGLKRNNRIFENENSNISNMSAFDHRKTSKGSQIITKRTPSIETTESSHYLAENVYINDASEKSSDVLSFCYHFPEDYSKYQFFNPNRSNNGREQLSQEKMTITNERLFDDDYGGDSKFFCYPSQVSWDRYENFQQNRQNINHQHYLKSNNTISEKRVEPDKKKVMQGESSKLCHGCCRPLNEDKGEKFFDDSYANKYGAGNNCSRNFVNNNLQCKDMTNLKESYRSKNDLVPNKDIHFCQSSNHNLNNVRKTNNYSLPNTTIDANHQRHNNNVERSEDKSNYLKEQNAKMKSENIKKKQSNILHSQSVKKFFCHAKEYINFRKYSTGSLRSGLSNGVLEVGPLNSTSLSDGPVNKVENDTSISRKHTAQTPSNKRYSDCSVNKMQYRCPEAGPCPENNIDAPQLANIQSSLCGALKPTEALRNNTTLPHKNSNTKLIKPAIYTLSQANLQDEKYRLYGSNEITIDRSATGINDLKFTKNEYKILQSESECEGFSDDMYCYSSSEWQSEVAKNWVTMTKKKYITHDNRVKVSLKKNEPKSVYSLRSYFSNCKVEKEEKYENNKNKAMINATIALSPDKKKGKKNKPEVEDRFHENQCSKMKIDNKFSNLFSSSIKNNYKKIKGLVKKNHTQQKNKSPNRVPLLKSPSLTETQSQSFVTPVTSTYIATQGCDTTFVTENTTVERFYNESTINNYTSDSNYAKSDPIIRHIEPGTWQKFVTRTLSQQSTVISETENMEKETSSISNVSTEESSLQVRSNQRKMQPFDRSNCFKPTHKHYQNHFSKSESSMHRRGSKSYLTNRTVPSESIYEYNQSDGSVLNLTSECFQDPMVDPKTGFRPILPT